MSKALAFFTGVTMGLTGTTSSLAMGEKTDYIPVASASQRIAAVAGVLGWLDKNRGHLAPAFAFYAVGVVLGTIVGQYAFDKVNPGYQVPNHSSTRYSM